MSGTEHPRAVFVACCGAIVTVSFGWGGLSLCMPEMAEELEFDYATQGLVFSAPMWPFLVSLLAAWLADRVGFRRVLIFASVVQAAGWALLAEAGSLPHVLAASVLLGVGGSMVDPLLTPIVCALYPERRRTMANFLHGFFCIGLVGTVGLVIALQHVGLSWRVIYRVLAVLCLPYGLACAWLALPAQTHQGPVRRRTRSLISHPVFWMLVAMMALAGATESGPANWLPTFVRDLFTKDGSEASSAQIGMGLLLFGILMAIGRFLTSALSGRLGTRRLLVLSAGMCTVCLASTALPLGAAWQIGCLSLVGFGVACFWPTLLATAGDRFPQAGASMFSVLSAAGALGCAAAPAAIGWIADACDSLAPAMIALAVAPAAILVTSLQVTRPRAPQADMTEQVETRNSGTDG